MIDRARDVSLVPPQPPLASDLVQAFLRGATRVYVVRVSADGRVLGHNPAFATLLGAPSEHIDGSALASWTAGSARAPVPDPAPSGPVAEVLQLVDVLGSTHVLQGLLHATPEGVTFVGERVLEDGAPVSGEVDPAALRAEVERLRHALIERERLATLGRLSSSLAHTLSGPLSSIASHSVALERDFADLLGFANTVGAELSRIGQACPESETVIAQAAVDADLTHLAESIPRQLESLATGVGRLRGVVVDLRGFARPESRGRTWSTLGEIVERALRLLEPLAAERGVRFVRALGRLPSIECDPARLEQLVLSLVENALEASHGGATVEVSSSLVDGVQCLEVVDTGEGIGPGDLPRVREPLFTTRPGHAGVGLFVASRIVEEHGGQLELESRVGAGTRAVVRLPATPARKEE